MHVIYTSANPGAQMCPDACIGYWISGVLYCREFYDYKYFLFWRNSVFWSRFKDVWYNNKKKHRRQLVNLESMKLWNYDIIHMKKKLQQVKEQPKLNWHFVIFITMTCNVFLWETKENVPLPRQQNSSFLQSATVYFFLFSIFNPNKKEDARSQCADKTTVFATLFIFFLRNYCFSEIVQWAFIEQKHRNWNHLHLSRKKQKQKIIKKKERRKSKNSLHYPPQIKKL